MLASGLHSSKNASNDRANRRALWQLVTTGGAAEASSSPAAEAEALREARRIGTQLESVQDEAELHVTFLAVISFLHGKFVFSFLCSSSLGTVIEMQRSDLRCNTT